MDGLFHSEKIGKCIVLIFTFALTILLLISIFDKDPLVSEKENRARAQMPKFSFSLLFSGEYISSFENHYADTFPFRNFFLDANSQIFKITSRFSAGDDDIVIISSNKTEDDFGGESLEDAESRTDTGIER